jgi:hypothetical protein
MRQVRSYRGDMRESTAAAALSALASTAPVIMYGVTRTPAMQQLRSYRGDMRESTAAAPLSALATTAPVIMYGVPRTPHSPCDSLIRCSTPVDWRSPRAPQSHFSEDMEVIFALRMILDMSLICS